MLRFEKCARRTLAVSVPASAARPSAGLGRALTAQGSRSLPSTPRAVPGQSLGVRTLRCGLYEVLGGQPPVPTSTDTHVLELYPRYFTRDSLPYTVLDLPPSTRGERR